MINSSYFKLGEAEPGPYRRKKSESSPDVGRARANGGEEIRGNEDNNETDDDVDTGLEEKNERLAIG